jgi:hypothetical protein
MPSRAFAYSEDQTWRLMVVAWKVDLWIFYKAIGGTAKLSHWENVTIPIINITWGQWVARRAEYISLQADFFGPPPTRTPAGSRIDRRKNSAEADARVAAGGGSFPVALPNDPAPGFGEEAPPSQLGPQIVKVEATSVRATGYAKIGVIELSCVATAE